MVSLAAHSVGNKEIHKEIHILPSGRFGSMLREFVVGGGQRPSLPFVHPALGNLA